MRNPVVALWLALAPLFANLKTSMRTLAADTRAAAGLGSSLSMVWVIIGTVISITILAALAPTFFTAIADLVSAVTTGTTNSTVADALLVIFGLVLAVSLVVGFVMLALRASPGKRF